MLALLQAKGRGFKSGVALLSYSEYMRDIYFEIYHGLLCEGKQRKKHALSLREKACAQLWDYIYRLTILLIKQNLS